MKHNSRISLEDLDGLAPEEMSLPELKTLLIQLNDLYDDLQPLEPDEDDEDAWDEWQDDLETVDDIIDEVRDRIEELE